MFLAVTVGPVSVLMVVGVVLLLLMRKGCESFMSEVESWFEYKK